MIIWKKKQLFFKTILNKTFYKRLLNKINIPFIICDRRDGDIGEYYADNSKVIESLSWKPKYSLEDMCRDSWNWQKLNPNY